MGPNETWQCQRPNATPEAVVQEFIDELFPGRKPAGFTGEWNWPTFRGQFSLVDGRQTYLLTGDRYGRYVVSVLEPATA